MRYDDYDDYTRSYRSSGSSRRSSSSRSGGRDYDRDSYRERDYRDYDYREDYDRNYYDRDRYSDRYNTRSNRDWYDDFDRSDWERTAPDWEDHGGSRKKRSSGGSTSRSSRPSSGSRGSSRGSSSRSGSSSRNGASRSAQNSRNGSRRPPEDQRRGSSSQRRSSSKKQKSAMQFVPIIVGLVVIILAALVIRSMLGAKSTAEIEFSSKEIVLGESITATLKGWEDDSGTAEPKVQWSSSDYNVVDVKGDGLTCTLTAKSLGNATITAMVDDKKVASSTIQAVETASGVQEIRVTEDDITIYSGETYTIDAKAVMEEGYSEATIKWSSNNTSVAKVDSNGVITGQEVGNAIVKGVAGEKTVEITVKVVENPNSTPHQSGEDVGQEPEEGADSTDGNTTGTGTTTGGTGSTGTGTGTTGGENTGGTGDTTQGGTGDGTDAAGSGE